jgi:hypothetical protein
MASTIEDDFLFILVLSMTCLPKIKGSNQVDFHWAIRFFIWQFNESMTLWKFKWMGWSLVHVGVHIAFVVARINFGTIDAVDASTQALTILRGINDEEGLKCN